MKKYLIIATLIISILPVGLKAKQLTDAELQDLCDNEIWYEQLENESKEDYIKYLIGEENDKTKYNKKALSYCVNREGRWCEWAVFLLYYYYDMRMFVNYPSAALAVNNKELFEDLVKEYPFLIDNAIVDYENYHSNYFFYTPALFMVRNSQFGVLKWLIEKYQVNLLKNSGFIYRDKTKPQKQINAKELAQQTLEEWKKNGNEIGIQCAQKTLEVVEDWYKKYKNDRKYNNQALKDYNKELNRIANIENQKVENRIPAEYRGEQPVNLFELEENYAENAEIENQINNLHLNMLMEKIMSGFDLSLLGNKA